MTSTRFEAMTVEYGFRVWDHATGTTVGGLHSTIQQARATAAIEEAGNEELVELDGYALHYC